MSAGAALGGGASSTGISMTGWIRICDGGEGTVVTGSASSGAAVGSACRANTAKGAAREEASGGRSKCGERRGTGREGGTTAWMTGLGSTIGSNGGACGRVGSTGGAVLVAGWATDAATIRWLGDRAEWTTTERATNRSEAVRMLDASETSRDRISSVEPSQTQSQSRSSADSNLRTDFATSLVSLLPTTSLPPRPSLITTPAAMSAVTDAAPVPRKCEPPSRPLLPAP